MMRRFLIGVSLLAGGWARAEPVPPAAIAPAAAGEFTVEVDGKVYDAEGGKAVSVTTAHGEKLKIVVRRKSVLHYASGQLTFDYPSAMTLAEQTLPGAASITLESAKSPLVILQVYRVDSSPEEVRSTLLRSLREEFLARKAFVDAGEKTISRPIHGVAREGRRLVFKLAGEAQQADIYTFKLRKAMVALVLQNDLDDAELAKAYFPVVTNSIE